MKNLHKSILDNDEEVLDKSKEDLVTAYTPKHVLLYRSNISDMFEVIVDAKQWIKKAQMSNWIDLLDSIILSLRIPKENNWNNIRNINIRCLDCYLNFRLYIDGSGSIHTYIALTKEPLMYRSMTNQEYINQREKFQRNRITHSQSLSIPPYYTRERVIEKIKEFYQSRLEDLYIQ